MGQEHILKQVDTFDNKYSEELQRDLALWAAVFRQAVIDYVETLRAERATSRSTREMDANAPPPAKIKRWFDDDEVYVGSFAWLCGVFNQDTGAVRRLVNNNWRTLHATKASGFIKKKAEIEEDDDDGDVR